MTTLLYKVLPWLRKDEEKQAAAGFGAHDIGRLGSLCLMCNNIMGPGMFQMPGLIQQAGWFPVLFSTVVAAVWTTQSGLYLARTMQRFRGNHEFGQRLEFNKIAFALLPRWGYNLAIATICAVLFSQNLANIIMVGQVMDSCILTIAGKSCALDLGSFSGVCVTSDNDTTVTDSLFGSSYVFSGGYLVVLLVSIPLGILNLDDNIVIQIGGMALTVVCVLAWVANFFAMGLQPDLVPAFGTGALNYAPLLSTVLFNYGFVATIPSWINEKGAKVPVASTICWANFAASLQYIVVALFSALAIANVGSTDLLSMLNEGGAPGVWSASSTLTFVFPIANLLTSIPIFSIIIRYNLLQLHGVKVPVWLANLVAVVLPWVVAIPFYPGNSLDTIITWSSALLFVLLNLIFPLWMYLVMEGKVEAGEAVVAEGDGADGTARDDMGGLSGLAKGARDEELGDDVAQGLLAGEDRQGAEVDGEGTGAESEVHAVPLWCIRLAPKAELNYAWALLAASAATAGAAFGLQVYLQVDSGTGN